MNIQEQEERDFHPATDQEIAREQAGILGGQRPEREWILTNYDTWERNPFYTGKPGRHPEEQPEDEES